MASILYVSGSIVFFSVILCLLHLHLSTSVLHAVVYLFIYLFYNTHSQLFPYASCKYNNCDKQPSGGLNPV